MYCCAMEIELRNLRRSGSAVLVDAKVRDGSGRAVHPVTLRMVGRSVQPSLATDVPRELMDAIFAAVREFSEKNHEKLSSLFFGHDRTNP